MAISRPEYTNSQIRELIREKIHSRRDRKILFLKLVDGLTFGEIAEETGMPISTITDAYYKQTKILFQDFPG